MHFEDVTGKISEFDEEINMKNKLMIVHLYKIMIGEL